MFTCKFCFVLAFLGLSSWKVGLAYGAAFTVPMLLIAWFKPVDWMLIERLIKQRAVAQFVSAILLGMCGLIVLALPQ